MTQFQDIEFKPHPSPLLAQFGAIQAIIKFPNGYSVSLVKGVSFFGDTDKYQVWRSIDLKPIHGLTEEEAYALIKELQERDSVA